MRYDNFLWYIVLILRPNMSNISIRLVPPLMVVNMCIVIWMGMVMVDMFVIGTMSMVFMTVPVVR